MMEAKFLIDIYRRRRGRKNVNLGCGVVFVNYDGKKKHRIIVGDNAFVGCNTNLVAPVRVERNSYIAAGSTTTDDVPQNA